MIRELTDSVGEVVFTNVGKAVSRAQERRPLPVDLLESEDAYLAIFDAAGVDESDVTATFEDGTIRVQIDRFRDFASGYEMVFPGRGISLSGSVSLPENAVVDPVSATATLKTNGTLHVLVPKVDEQSSADTTVDVAEESRQDVNSEHNGEDA